MASLFTPSVKRFLRYASIGISTLVFDLMLLFMLTGLFSVPYYIATPIGFLAGVSLNYLISRRYVFKGTERTMRHGYAYFILMAGAGALAITGAVALLVTYLHLPFLLSRVLIAGVVGIANYLGNLYFNFRVVGKHI